jgi:hypothetical protein
MNEAGLILNFVIFNYKTVASIDVFFGKNP